MFNFKKINKGMLRSYIVRFFALSYMVNINNRVVSWVRAANIIFPLLLLLGLSFLKDWEYIFIVTLLLFIVSVYFGFVHFNFYPLTKKDFKYMSETQIFQYEHYYKNTDKQISKYDALWILLLNPFLLFLFIIIMFL